MKRHKGHKKHASEASMALLYSIVGILVLTGLFLGSVCWGQTTSTNPRMRLTQPHPELYHEPCEVTLGRIKGQMLDVTRKEIDYNNGKKKAVRFYETRFTTVLSTHDLVPSVMTCTTGSVKELNYILAKWELDWVQERYQVGIEDGIKVVKR